LSLSFFRAVYYRRAVARGIEVRQLSVETRVINRYWGVQRTFVCAQARDPTSIGILRRPPEGMLTPARRKANGDVRRWLTTSPTYVGRDTSIDRMAPRPVPYRVVKLPLSTGMERSRTGTLSPLTMAEAGKTVP